MLKFITIVIICTLAVLLVPHIAQSDVETQVATTTPKVHIAKTFESEIKRLAVKYGKDVLTAKAVISCEGQLYKTIGNNKNYDKSGKVWSIDVGWWQINDYYHLASAKKLGLDIHDQWENLEYGFILWTREGLKPWSASKPCWSKKISARDS